MSATVAIALQTNMADNAMRDHGATSLENMLYVNGLGFWIVLVFAAVVDGDDIALPSQWLILSLSRAFRQFGSRHFYN